MAVGGAERQLSLIAPAQARSGVEVHVALLQAGPHLDRLLDAAVDVHRIQSSGNNDPRIGISLVHLMGALRPTIVQTWLPQMDIFGGLAAKMRSRAWVLSERSMGAAYQARLKETVLRPVIGRRADAIVANSAAGLSYWERRVENGTLLRLVPNALPIDEIRDATATSLIPSASRTGGPLVLFAGRLSPEKNLTVFIQAIGMVARARPITALLCGDGPSRDDLARLVDELALNDRVFFAGIRHDLWGVMKAASMVVNPSIFEGQPNVVLEAAAAGVPLVLSDIPGHRDVAGQDGALFFSADSPEELACAILRTLGDAAQVNARIQRGSEIASELSIDRAVRGYQAVYDELLSR